MQKLKKGEKKLNWGKNKQNIKKNKIKKEAKKKKKKIGAKKCYEEVFELKTLIFEAEIWAKMAKKGKKKKLKYKMEFLRQKNFNSKEMY